MMKFTALDNSKTQELISSIIKNENLSVVIEKSENALGDSTIEIKGEREDVETLKQIYNMVK